MENASKRVSVFRDGAAPDVPRLIQLWRDYIRRSEQAKQLLSASRPPSE